VSEDVTKPNGSVTPSVVKLRPRVPVETKAKILRERATGVTYNELEKKYGVAKNTMIAWVSLEKKLGTELGKLSCTTPNRPPEQLVPTVVPISPAIFDPLAKFTELHRVEDAQALRDIVIELLLENYHLRHKR
jgi:hypothetical protein